jgi:hypothetical protein
MGVFAWFRRGGRGDDRGSGRGTEPATGAPAGEPVAGAEAVAIPKQTVAAEAADSETGEGARQ